MNRTGVLAGVLSILVCAGLLSGCGKEAPPNPTGTTAASQPAPEPEDYTSVTVTTPYGKLYYDEQWSSWMRTEQEREGNNLTVTFKAIVSQKSYSLFRVIVGELDEEPVGQLTDDKGTKRNVYIIVDDLIEDPDLSAEDQNLLYSMLEEVNHVIEKLN